MIDVKRRSTLKALAVTAGAVIANSTARAAVLFESQAGGNGPGLTKNGPVQLDVVDGLSPGKNNLEIVLTNTATDSTVITQIAPQKISTSSGDFLLQSVLRDGPLALNAGEYVTIPLTRQSVDSQRALQHSAASLRYVLRNNVSIVTDQESAEPVIVLA